MVPSRPAGWERVGREIIAARRSWRRIAARHPVTGLILVHNQLSSVALTASQRDPARK